MGHDILICVDHKIEAQLYDVLLKYIGANNHKTYPKESDKKMAYALSWHKQTEK